jgi:recombinational DNA repair protein (RecF pathway)
MATTTNDGMTTEGVTYRPITLPCPRCGQTEEAIHFDVRDGRLACAACDEEITRADLDALIDEARRLIRFLDMAATI